MDPNYDAEVIGYYDSSISLKYVVNAVSALGAYDYLLTISDEWALLLGRKWTGSTWILIVNRMTMLLGIMWPLIPYTEQVQVFTNILALLPIVVAGVFSALRVFALTDHNLIVAGLVVLLTCVPFGINVYAQARTSFFFFEDSITGPTCVFNIPITSATAEACTFYNRLSISSRLAIILVDAIVVFATWKRTYQHSREAKQLGMQTSISATLLRDGSIYFVVLLLLNLAQLLNNVWPQGPYVDINVMPQFNNMFQFIIITRFIINLRQSDTSSSTESTGQSPSQFSAPNFRMPTIDDVVGDMGQSLDFRSQEDDTEVEQGSDTASQVESPGKDGSIELVVRSPDSLSDAEKADTPL